jgi:hypothetical protein
MNEMMKDPRWYSPLNVIAHYHSDFATTKPTKKAEEMWAVAVMITGMQEIENNRYWMQPVSDTEGTPDVRTILRHERPADDDRARDHTYQDVEVVTYTTASYGVSLPDFLLQTKLSPKKAYDVLTTVLVYIKDAAKCPPNVEWTTALKNVKLPIPAILLGRSHPTDPIYTLSQLHPIPRPLIEFHLGETLLKRGYTGVLDLHRGTKNITESREGEDHCPFESLGVECHFEKLPNKSLK